MAGGDACLVWGLMGRCLPGVGGLPGETHSLQFSIPTIFCALEWGSAVTLMLECHPGSHGPSLQTQQEESTPLDPHSPTPLPERNLAVRPVVLLQHRLIVFHGPIGNQHDGLVAQASLPSLLELRGDVVVTPLLPCPIPAQCSPTHSRPAAGSGRLHGGLGPRPRHL